MDKANICHIWLQQNGRRKVTIVSDLPLDLTFSKVLIRWRKQFNCNGTLIEDEKFGTIIQLTGDQRENVRNFLDSENIVSRANIRIHGC